MSTRIWTLQQLLRSGRYSSVVLAKIEHPEDDVYVWNGLGYLDFDGQLWKSLGRLASVSIGPSDVQVKITDVVFTLSGVDTQFTRYLETTVKGSKAWVWKAFLGEDYRVRFTYEYSDIELDQPSFKIEPNGTATVRIAGNSGFYFLEPQSRASLDPEEQRNFLISRGIDPDSDTGFDMIHQMRNLQLAWEQPD